uniref:Uncharacterized protein n=1 Tax=Moniliophthora roreri TaxID=221103 RepID=A0A0W0F4Q0_MONRR
MPVACQWHAEMPGDVILPMYTLPINIISLRATLECQASWKNMTEKGFECIWVTRHTPHVKASISTTTQRFHLDEGIVRQVEHYRMYVYGGWMS